MYFDKASFYIESVSEEEAGAIVDYFDKEQNANVWLEQTGPGFSVCFECDDLNDLKDYEDILSPYLYNTNDFNFNEFKADYLDEEKDN